MKRAHLYIHVFRNSIKVFAGIVMTLGLLLLTEKIWEYFLYDDTMDEGRAIMYDFYHQDGIDNLFLGSSHVYFDINPVILNAATGKKNFNLSTPMQPMIASYYLLREADRKYDISKVYLEMYCEVSLANSGMPVNWKAMDYMYPSVNKLDYIAHMGEPTERYLDFFRARRMWQNAFEPKKLAEIWKNKQSESYRNHEWVKINEHGKEYFCPGGYVYTEFLIDNETYTPSENTIIFSENPMAPEAETYLKKILEFCKEKEISITLFISPVTESLLSGYENYDNYVNQVSGIAAEYGVEFYDYNSRKEGILDMKDREYWRDPGHMNIWRAEKFTSFFCETAMKEETVNREAYFYTSYQKKLEDTAGSAE